LIKQIEEYIDLTDPFPDDFQQVKLFIKKGEYKEALPLVEEILQKARINETHFLIVEGLLHKSTILWRSSRYEEGLQVIEDGEELLTKTEIQQNIKEEKIGELKSSFLNNKGVIYWYMGELDQALEYFESSLTISEELGDKAGMGKAFNNIGLIYESKGNLDPAIKYYTESLLIHEKTGDKRQISAVLNNLGNLYHKKGEHDQALEYQQRSLSMKEEIGDYNAIALSLINIGVNYELKGELSLALDYYQRGKKICVDLDYKNGIALALNNLGGVYEMKGELSLALDYLQQSLSLYEELGTKNQIALSLLNISSIYSKQSNHDWAIKTCKESLKIFREVQDELAICYTLYDLVLLYLAANEISSAQHYLQELKQLSEHLGNPVVNHRYRVTKALILKMSKRTRDRVKAQDILEGIIKEEILDFELTKNAMLHLLELLLIEYKNFEEEIVYNEAMDLIDRLYEIAQQQHSFFLSINVLIFKARIEIIHGEYDKAVKMLEQAHLLAEEKGISGLIRKIEEEQQTMRDNISKWEDMLDKTSSVSERMKYIELENYLNKMIKYKEI
jgi:tetratricopeptide (TPR) repeat protein